MSEWMNRLIAAHVFLLAKASNTHIHNRTSNSKSIASGSALFSIKNGTTSFTSCIRSSFVISLGAGVSVLPSSSVFPLSASVIA